MAERTHTIVSAEAPSNAEPISERVVKPEALEDGQRKLGELLRMKPTLDREYPSEHKMLALESIRTPVCLVYRMPW